MYMEGKNAGGANFNFVTCHSLIFSFMNMNSVVFLNEEVQNSTWEQGCSSQNTHLPINVLWVNLDNLFSFMNFDAQAQPKTSDSFSQVCDFQLYTRYSFSRFNIVFQKSVWTQIHKFRHHYSLSMFSKALKCHLISVRFKTFASAYLQSAKHFTCNLSIPKSCTPLC